MTIWACLLAVLALRGASAEREYLSPDRRLSWENVTLNRGPFRGQPEQVHISYGGAIGTMIVTWLTYDDTKQSFVEYDAAPAIRLTKKTNAKISVFVDGGKKHVWRYVHRATLVDLKPGTLYHYRVGSTFGWSSVFKFTALKPRPEGGYRFAVYGDMGNENARSLGAVQTLAQQGDIDAVLHVGDFAYNMFTDDGYVGDEFMRQIEPAAAYVPYMTAVGNHEAAYNFTHYVHRFTMPNTEHNLFYSYDLGDAHFIWFSTEFYFFTEFGWKQIENQYRWLTDDLEKATRNRHNVPWIITLGHRPMYCSDLDNDDCTKYESIIRVGLPESHAYGLEKLFYKYGVDLEIWAHEHSYERMWPVYNRTVYNGTKQPYLDPPAPVHIVTGSAGCNENTDTFQPYPPPWSAFRSSNYGFSLMHVYNSTHIHFEQRAAAVDKVEDEFWIVKSRHGTYSPKDHKRLLKKGVYIPFDYCHHPSHCNGSAKSGHGERRDNSHRGTKNQDF